MLWAIGESPEELQATQGRLMITKLGSWRPTGRGGEESKLFSENDNSANDKEPLYPLPRSLAASGLWLQPSSAENVL